MRQSVYVELLLTRKNPSEICPAAQMCGCVRCCAKEWEKGSERDWGGGVRRSTSKDMHASKRERCICLRTYCGCCRCVCVRACEWDLVLGKKLIEGVSFHVGARVKTPFLEKILHTHTWFTCLWIHHTRHSNAQQTQSNRPLGTQPQQSSCPSYQDDNRIHHFIGNHLDINILDEARIEIHRFELEPARALLLHLFPAPNLHACWHSTSTKLVECVRMCVCACVRSADRKSSGYGWTHVFSPLLHGAWGNVGKCECVSCVLVCNGDYI